MSAGDCWDCWTDCPSPTAHQISFFPPWLPWGAVRGQSGTPAVLQHSEAAVTGGQALAGDAVEVQHIKLHWPWPPSRHSLALRHRHAHAPTVSHSLSAPALVCLALICSPSLYIWPLYFLACALCTPVNTSTVCSAAAAALVCLFFPTSLCSIADLTPS